MATSQIKLPPGFVLEEQQETPDVNLPPGFVLESPQERVSVRMTSGGQEFVNTDQETPQGGPVSRFASGVYQTTVGPLVDIYKHQQENVKKYGPFWATFVTLGEIAKGTITASNDQAVEALKELAQGHLGEFVQHAPGVIPLVGPAAVGASEEMQRGNVAGGLGQATGLVAATKLPEMAIRGARSIRLRPIFKNPNTTQAEAIDFGIQEGIPVDAGTATGNVAVKGTQWLADKSIGGSFVSGAEKAAQAKALETTGNRLAAELHPTSVVPEQAGRSIANQIRENIKNLHESETSAYGRLERIEADPSSLRRIEVGAKPTEQATARAIEPEVAPLVNDAVEARLSEIKDLFNSGIGELSGKGKNLDTSSWNADAIKNLKHSETGYGKIPVKRAFPELSDIPENPKRIADAIEKDKNNPLYLRVKEKVAAEIPELYAKEIEEANIAARESRTAQTPGNYVEVALPVDMRPVKQALAPVYKEMLRTMPRAQQNASPGLVAIKNVLDSENFLPASVAERNLSALKKDAGYNIDAGMRSQSQGLAAYAVKNLQNQIDAAVAKAGPEAIEALKSGRMYTRMKYDAQAILKELRKEPVQAFNQATWAKDAGIDYLRKLNKQAPIEMQMIGRAYIDDLLTKATAEGAFDKTQGIWSRWQNLGPETKKIIFKDPVLIDRLDKFFLLAKKMAENPNPSGTGHIVSLGSQIAYTFLNPVTGVPIQIGAGALSKLLHSPKAVKILIRGMEISVSKKFASRVAAMELLSLAGKASQQQDEPAR